jgi:hypothetical protein
MEERMNRKTLASLIVFVTLGTAPGVQAQTPSMQDALTKKTPAYVQTTSSLQASL